MQEIPIQTRLKEVALNPTDDNLEALKDAKKWHELAQTDKELLASLFISQGKRLLAAGDHKADDSFACVVRLLPESAYMYHQIGSLYASIESNSYFLKRSADYFNHSLRIDQKHYSSHIALGCVYNRLGCLNNEFES